MNALAAPFLLLVLTLLACGRPGSGSTNSSLTSQDEIFYSVEYNNSFTANQDNTYSIKYGSRVVLTCVVKSLQNIPLVTWYRRIGNSSKGLPLSPIFWGSEQYLQVDEYIAKTDATIMKFAEFFAGNYYCVAFGNNSTIHGTSGINITVKPFPLQDEPTTDNRTTECILPQVKDIDASQHTISRVRNGTEFVNVTLNWRYEPASKESWCDTGEFAVRYVTWSSVYDVPLFDNPPVNAYESNNFNWEPWKVVPRGNHSLTIPFLSKDLYYLFQVAIPRANLDVHAVWYSENANRYSSRVTYYNGQRGVTIDDFPVKLINVTEGTPVNLTCIARGVPKPSVVWLREVPGSLSDQYASTSNIHFIDHARVSDSGKYICNAHNALLLGNRLETTSESQHVILMVHQRTMDSGKCFEVRPAACEAYLPSNSTLWSASERELARASSSAATLQDLPKQTSMEEQCAARILELFCKWSMPICSVNATPTRVCKSSCDAVVDECASMWLQARSIIKEMESWDDCFDLHDTDGCVTVTQDLQASPTPSATAGPIETDAQVIGVVIGVLALVALVVVLLVAVCCYCRHMSQSKFTSLSDLPTLDIESSSIRMSLSENPYYQRRRCVSISEKDMERLHQIGKDEITYISELGHGNFGRVFKGEVRGLVPNQDVTTVAVKNLLEEDNEAAVKAFLHEAKIMSRFDHPSIVKLLAVSITTSPFYLVFEFMSEGDLNEYLHQKASSKQKRLMNPSPMRSRTESALSNDPSELSSEQLLYVSLQIAEGMKYLADNNHVHRDLATRNCLVGEKLVVKIGDFGMSQHLYHNDYYRVHGEAALPVRWMPPESIVYGTFTTETDVWSFGVVMWEVFSFAMQPYYGKSNEEVCDLVRRGVSLDCPETCPPEVYSLMQSCWSLTPNNRPSFKNLCVKLSLLSQGKADSPIMPRDTQSISSQDSTVFGSSPAPSPFFNKDAAQHPSDDSDMEA